METVFANLIQRKDKIAFEENIIAWQKNNENLWKNIFEKLNRWLVTKGMWRDYTLFRKVIVEGIYPMHPISTFMLTQLSDYLQNRSSLTLISQYIDNSKEVDISNNEFLIMPETLMRGDLYTEMLAAEQEGKQPSQQCIRFDNIMRKYGDKLSEKSLVVLRANLILRILRFRTKDYADAKEALSVCSGFSISEIEEELKWLENEYAVLGFDDHAGCFDFMEESNGAHDFKDNGYELDEESKNTVKELISSLKSEVEQLITPYLANMYCKSVEGVNTFRNHNTKMQNMLEELGFTNYAMQVKRRKEEELSNIDEIRSRQELRADCEKYLEESQITRYVTYVNVCLYLKSGKELQARVKKYGVALGKDAQKIQENINDRVAALEKNHDRTMQDMSDIWDDLYEVKNADDVEMLIDNIASVLQKGIPDADRLDFEELQKNLSELLNDINEIKRVTNSRNEFKKISEDMINKYEHSEFDFEVLPIIHEVISDMENNMNVREQEWINSVLTLGDKSRKAVHKWKEKTAYLPEYLSEETIEKVKMVDKEADEIISEGKIEDVLFYFDKLDDVEKLECIQKLQNRLNR